jgi:hypothetical protein
MEASPEPEKPEAPPERTGSQSDPKSWSFWRKRLSRALIVGALGLTAAQLLPALPEDQILLIEPPAGVLLTGAELTYFSTDDGEALLGTELTPGDPAPHLVHSVRLPNSDYLITVVASGTDAASREQRYTLTRRVALSGSTARVFLKASKPGP